MKLTVAKKLGLAFGTLIVLMLVSTILSHIKSAESEETRARVADVRTPTIVGDMQLMSDLNLASTKVRQVVIAGTDKQAFDKGKSSFDSAWQSIDGDVAKLAELSPHWTLEMNRERFASTKEALPKLRAAQQEALQIASSGDRDALTKAGTVLVQKATPINDAIRKALTDMTDSQTGLTLKDQAALQSNIRSQIWTLWISTLLALVISVSVAVYLSRVIVHATGAALKQAEAIAKGDLTGKDIQVSTNDELGDLAKSLNLMHRNLVEVIESIAQNAENVANASEEFSAVSQQISANSEETSAQANSVSAATEQVNRGLQTMSAATEEMSASIQEISKNTSEAAKVAGNAMKTAADTNAIVSKLGDSSAEIGQVIKVITTIAEQTNLLALNATIEAARAGDAGKGFAVVANEVKELAKQTAKATEDIGRKVETIQEDTKSAVAAISSITGVIGQVNDISGTIATAVEEQTATTAEMSRNVAEAAKGSGDVAQNIHGVAQAAQSTSHGATESQKAAKGLAEMSTQLRELVGRFKLQHNGQPASHNSGNGDRGSKSTRHHDYEAELAASR